MIDYPDNFTRSELLHSDTAVEKGINNEPTYKQHEDNLLVLAYWLQRLRDKLSEHYGRDVAITLSSGYRSVRLNSEVGGSITSYHMKGLAADIKAKGLSTKELVEFIAKNFLDYDQVIDEYGRWVHVGLPIPRRQLMKIEKKGQYENIDFGTNK